MTLMRTLALAVLALFATGLQAQTAHETVDQVMQELFADLTANKSLYQQDNEAFFQAMDRMVGEAVDVRGVARSVMGVHARRASEEQIDRFQLTFKDSLMRFYGKALLEYDNQDVRMLPARKAEGDTRAEVNMEVRDTRGTVYPVVYSMVRVGDRWMLRNVKIEGLNLGLMFRDQFAELVKKNRGNLDAVIDSWAEVVASTDQKAAQ